jgi:hypothetical protein
MGLGERGVKITRSLFLTQKKTNWSIREIPKSIKKKLAILQKRPKLVP